MNKVIRVNHKQVYDLVFRARNVRLSAALYVLDFLDWIKAGVAFNTRGFENPSRKIAYFAELYSVVQEMRPAKEFLSEALTKYYEDIFEIYQDHLRAKQAAARQDIVKAVPKFEDLFVVPCFDSVPFMFDLFETRTVHCRDYKCVKASALASAIASANVRSDSPLYKCMAVLYDYGTGCVEQGKLLEVDCGFECD